MLCLQDNVTLGQLSNQTNPGITIYNITHPWGKRAIGLLSTGNGAALGLVAPWGGFVYHEALFHNLSDALSVLSESTGSALTRLSLSLSSLANKVMANRLALDFLLAKQGVCAVINKTRCTYINNTGLVEKDVKNI